MLLYNYRNRSSSFIFAMGTVLGGVYEYLCSVFTEIVFGKIFWDYSGFMFNIGGRVNLLFCFFWGIAGVVWLKGVYPYLSKWIEKIPMLAGKIITWCLIIFMAADSLVSAAALMRQDQREKNIPASNVVQQWLDENYDDETLYKIYPKQRSQKRLTNPKTSHIVTLEMMQHCNTVNMQTSVIFLHHTIKKLRKRL